MVRMPARRPGGSRASTAATCMSDEVATGTPHARASSACWRARKPQLVVRPSAPSPTSSLPASTKASRSPVAPWRTTRSGDASRTTRKSTGNGQVAELPTSPGMRGNRVSSIRIPMPAP